MSRDRMESLLFLTKLRCPVHEEMVMVQRRDGLIMFWCGCTRAAGPSESVEAGLSRRIVELKH